MILYTTTVFKTPQFKFIIGNYILYTLPWLQDCNPIGKSIELIFSKQKNAALSAFAVAPKTLHKKNLASSMLTFAP